MGSMVLCHSIEMAMVTILQTIYDKEIIDNYDKADEVLECYLFSENDERGQGD